MNAAVSTSFESKTQLNVSMFSHWMCCSLKTWSMWCMLEPIKCYTLSWLFEIWLILVHIYIYIFSAPPSMFLLLFFPLHLEQKSRNLDQDTLTSGESRTASLRRALLIYSPVDLVQTLNVCVCMWREPASTQLSLSDWTTGISLSQSSQLPPHHCTTQINVECTFLEM